MSKDAAYCFYCFLFRKEVNHEKFGHEVFRKTGYDNWKHAATRGFQIIVVLLKVAITKLGGVLMTLKIKGQVCHENLKGTL